jgi:hypothetical protein
MDKIRKAAKESTPGATRIVNVKQRWTQYLTYKIQRLQFPRQ